MEEKKVAGAAPAPKRRESGEGGPRKRTRDEDGDGDVPEHAAPGPKRRQSGGAGGDKPRKRNREEKDDGDVPEHAAPGPKRRDSGGAGGDKPRKRTREEKDDGDVPEHAAPGPKRREYGGGKAQDDKVGKDAPDHISKVGNDILRMIISRLPPIAGARTQAVARRWRPLWRKSYLNLDADLLSNDEFERFSMVRLILSKHPGPVHRFTFESIRLHKRKKRFAEEAAEFESWFRSPVLVGLQELNISFRLLTRKKKPKNFRLGQSREKLYQLPASVFATAPTLLKAKICSCKFPVEIPSGLDFPLLEKLHLWRAIISEEVFQKILSCCPVLVSLDLHGLNNVGSFRISSPTLKSVALSCCFSVEGELTIVDVPCLERLLLPDLLGGRDKVKVIRAPKLEILGPLSTLVSRIQIADIIFKGLTPSTLVNTISTVKVLALQFSSPDLNAVGDVLECFPCLEKLYFTRRTSLDMPMEENVMQSDPTGQVICLETNLQELMMTHYEGDEQDVTFVKFFLLKANALKKIKLKVAEKVGKGWVADQHRLLQVEAKASPEAQLEFIHGSFVNLDIHDLSIRDPFIRYSLNAVDAVSNESP